LLLLLMLLLLPLLPKLAPRSGCHAAGKA